MIFFLFDNGTGYQPPHTISTQFSNVSIIVIIVALIEVSPSLTSSLSKGSVIICYEFTQKFSLNS
jgi:hypothetical protein